ncbi:hypothetical protein V490_06949 [Pseudogymnoascus sp. VKM F-3557]|nr:hypothetical protein V490_06949 [Pseudogymnoascus sp. VKM F-3557]
MHTPRVPNRPFLPTASLAIILSAPGLIKPQQALPLTSGLSVLAQAKAGAAHREIESTCCAVGLPYDGDVPTTAVATQRSKSHEQEKQVPI